MTASTRIRTNASLAFIGTGAVTLAQWLITVVLARVAGPSTVGSYAFALAVSAAAFAFLNMGLRTVYVSGAAATFPYGWLVNTRIVTSIIAILAVGGVVLIFQPEGFGIAVFAVIARAADAVGDLSYAYYQAKERFLPIALMQTASAVASISAVVIALAFGSTVLEAVAASAGTSVAMSGVIPWLAVRRQRRGSTRRQPPSHARRWRELLQTALPLSIAQLITALVLTAPRYSLGIFGTRDDLGVYFALSYVILAPTVLVAACAQAILPVMARSLRDRGRDSFVSLLRKTLYLTAIGGGLLLGAAVVFGERSITFVYGDAYSNNMSSFYVLVGATGLISVAYFLDVAMAAAGAFKSQMLANLATLMVALGAAVPLTSRLGLRGAALLTLLIAGAMCLSRGALLRSALLRRKPRETAAGESVSASAHC